MYLYGVISALWTTTTKNRKTFDETSIQMLTVAFPDAVILSRSYSSIFFYWWAFNIIWVKISCQYKKLKIKTTFTSVSMGVFRRSCAQPCFAHRHRYASQVSCQRLLEIPPLPSPPAIGANCSFPCCDWKRPSALAVWSEHFAAVPGSSFKPQSMQ